MLLKILKVVFVSLFPVMLLLFFTSCVKTPNDGFVVSKSPVEIDQIIISGEDLNEDNQTVLFSESGYEYSENIEYSLEENLIGAEITVDVNASVEVPKFFPYKYLVKSEKISYDQIHNLVELINSDGLFYKSRICKDIMTKYKMQMKIDYYLNEISLCTTEMNKQKDGYQDIVKDLYEQMQYLPDSYADITTDYLEKTIKTSTAINFQFTNENYNDKAHILDINESYSPDIFCVIAEDTQEQGIRYKKSANGKLFALDDEELNKSYSFSQSEAEVLAKQFVNAIDNDLSLIDASLLAVIDRDSNTKVNKYIPKGYMLVYSHKYGEVPINYSEEENYWKYQNENNQVYEEYYPQEYLVIFVDETGVIELKYNSPSEIVGKVDEKFELLSFNKVLNKFNDYIVLNGFKEGTCIL